MSKCRKRPWNLYKHKNSLLKRTLLDHRVQNVPQVSSESSLPWLVQNKPSATIRHVETRLNSSKDNFIAKSFRLSTKRKLSILLNFLFPFGSFIGVFSILSAKLWSWKLPHDERTPAILLMDDISRCQIGFFPHPLNGWQDHWEFFSASYVMSDISFSAGYFFPGIYLLAFFLSKSVCRTFFFFFWNHPITCAK